jgi:ABC-type transport system substrate-binding protein
MEKSYWSNIVGHRLSRRRALSVAAGTAATAALLAACGSSGGSATGPSKGGDKSGLIASPVDSTAQAKPGGILKDYFTGDAVHFDALASNANGVINWVSSFAYPMMTKLKAPKYPNQPDGSVEGEVGETYEISGDKLTLTFKLRQAMKWDSRTPTNGRPLDAEDVMFSWNKFVQLNQAAGNFAYSRAPSAPIDSLSAPDSKTIVVKMKLPDASILPMFADWSGFYVMPRESDKEFNPRNVVRGHGPWLLEEYEPSVRFVYRRNPDYYNKGKPYPEKLEKPIISEYAARLAQFRAGNIYTDTATPIDQIQTKKDVPPTLMQQIATWSASIWNGLSFGYEGNSPFKDVRVRQAVSMLVDRESYLDVLDNRDVFVKEGIDVPSALNSVVAPGWTDYWLDPKDEKKFGPSAKYLSHDVAEAKKLLAAAGYANGFDYDMYFSTSLYGATYVKSAELFSSMLLDGGLKVAMRGLPYEQFKDMYYEAYFPPSYNSGKTSGFNGIVHLANPAASTLASHLFTFVHKDGGRFHGMSPDGKNPQMGDPRLNSEIEKIRSEFDREKQVSLTHDLIRYFTSQSYYIPRPGVVKGFTLIWPALSDHVTYLRPPSDNQWSGRDIYWWIDSTKAPLQKT